MQRDLNGVSVVVTGAIGGETRRTAESKLRDAGAIVQSSVGPGTEILVTGGKVGATKMNAARRYGAEIVPWEVLVRGSAPADAWEEIQESGTDELTITTSARTYGPMLCKSADLPVGDAWLYEVKWDGYRCIARVEEGQVSMTSRSAKTDYVSSFPQIATILSEWPNVVLDGELVVISPDGSTSLETMGGNQGGASFVVFDVLEMFGKNLTAMPLTDRRRVLIEALELVFRNAGYGRIVVSPVFDDGEALLADVTERGLEGIVAKRKDGRYAENQRGWIKVKLRNQQEFVVLGWMPGKGALEGLLGSLLLGVREGESWKYVGRVGTGFDDRTRPEVEALLEPYSLGTDTRHVPLLGIDLAGASYAEVRGTNWVQPEIVVDVAFQRWSKDDRLVIPSFKGVRNDKDAIDVTREA